MLRYSPPVPRAPWQRAHVFRVDRLPARGVARERSFVEDRARRLLPRPKKRDYRCDVRRRERPSVVAAPRRHRRVHPPTGDGRAQELRSHRGEEVRLRESRRLIGFVPFAIGSVTHRAHEHIDAAAVALRNGFRRGIALERAARDRGDQDGEACEERTDAHEVPRAYSAAREDHPRRRRSTIPPADLRTISSPSRSRNAGGASVRTGTTAEAGGRKISALRVLRAWGARNSFPSQPGPRSPGPRGAPGDR